MCDYKAPVSFSHSSRNAVRSNRKGFTKAEIASTFSDGVPEREWRFFLSAKNFTYFNHVSYYESCIKVFSPIGWIYSVFSPDWPDLCVCSGDPVTALSRAASCSSLSAARCSLVTMAALSGPRASTWTAESAWRTKASKVFMRTEIYVRKQDLFYLQSNTTCFDIVWSYNSKRKVIGVCRKIHYFINNHKKLRILEVQESVYLIKWSNLITRFSFKLKDVRNR